MCLGLASHTFQKPIFYDFMYLFITSMHQTHYFSSLLLMASISLLQQRVCKQPLHCIITNKLVATKYMHMRSSINEQPLHLMAFTSSSQNNGSHLCCILHCILFTSCIKKYQFDVSSQNTVYLYGTCKLILNNTLHLSP